MSAKEQATELRSSGLAPSGARSKTLADLSEGGSTVLGSSVPSSVGPSASEAGGAGFADLMKAVTEIQVSVSGLSTRMDALETKKKQPGQMTCFNCGKTGHTLVDCKETIQDKYKKLYDKLKAESA